MAMKEDVKAGIDSGVKPAIIPGTPSKSGLKRLWKVDLDKYGPCTPSPYFALNHPTDPRLEPLVLKDRTGKPLDLETATPKEIEFATAVGKIEREGETKNYLRGQPIEAANEAEALTIFKWLHGIHDTAHEAEFTELTPEEAEEERKPPKAQKKGRRQQLPTPQPA